MLIPSIVGLMILHHGGDFLRKLGLVLNRTATFDPTNGSGEIRMFPSERILHGIMALSFVALGRSAEPCIASPR